MDYYDEIKEAIEKIYYEYPIPGKSKDFEKWGDKEQLRKYTGFIEKKDNQGNEYEVKIYVEYMKIKF